eukprot:7376133-Prymnesium_polylepis.1
MKAVLLRRPLPEYGGHRVQQSTCLATSKSHKGALTIEERCCLKRSDARRYGGVRCQPCCEARRH